MCARNINGFKLCILINIFEKLTVIIFCNKELYLCIKPAWLQNSKKVNALLLFSISINALAEVVNVLGLSEWLGMYYRFCGEEGGALWRVCPFTNWLYGDHVQSQAFHLIER